MPSEHSSWCGGSTAPRVLACPASVSLSAKVPKTGSNEFADMGTMLHKVCELVLREGGAPESYVGITHHGESGVYTLTEELLHSKILPALTALDELGDRYGVTHLYEECRVGFTSAGLEGAFGTSDVILIGDGCVIIADFKFGDGVKVSATENESLMFYAAAASQTDGVAEHFKNAKKLVFAIIQPRQYGSGETLDVWETTTKAIKPFIKRLTAARAAAFSDNPPVNTGAHCRWCPAISVCNAALSASVQASRLDIALIPALESALAQVDAIETWCKEVRKTAHEQLERGVKLKGFKLVPKRGRRVWNDPAAAAAAIADAGHDPWTHELISPAQADKLKIDTSALTSMVSSGTTLAPDTDKRTATVPREALRNALKHIATRG